MLCLIVIIFTVIISSITQTYYVVIVGLLATRFILTISSVNDLIYTVNIAKEVAAMGFIMLSMANVNSQSPNVYYIANNWPDCVDVLLCSCSK